MRRLTSRSLICGAVKWKIGENRLSHVFRSASVDLYRIANQRPEGESTHNFASLRIHHFLIAGYLEYLPAPEVF